MTLGTPGPTALAGAAALGPRFAAVIGRPSGWIAAGELFGDRLADHVARVAEIRGAPNAAVAGTLLFQQYAGLLVAPAVAAVHEEGRRLPYDPAAVRVRTIDGAPVQVAFAEPALPVPGTPAQERLLLATDLLRGHLGRCADAVRRRCRGGRRVLDGEIANAVTTAYLHLSWRRADHAALVGDARAVLAAAGLAALVAVEAADVDGRPWMFAGRRSCCLAFRTVRHRERSAPERYCATCPVRAGADVRRSFEAAVRSYSERPR